MEESNDVLALEIVMILALAGYLLTTFVLVFRASRRRAWSSAVWLLLFFAVFRFSERIIVVLELFRVAISPYVKLAVTGADLFGIMLVFLAPIAAALAVSRRVKFNSFTVWLVILIILIIISDLFILAVDVLLVVSEDFDVSESFLPISVAAGIIFIAGFFLGILSFVISISAFKDRLGLSSLQCTILQWMGGILVVCAAWQITVVILEAAIAGGSHLDPMALAVVSFVFSDITYITLLAVAAGGVRVLSEIASGGFQPVAMGAGDSQRPRAGYV